MTKKRRKPQVLKRGTPGIEGLPRVKDVPMEERARLKGVADGVKLKNGYYPAWRLAQLCEMVSASRDMILREYLKTSLEK